MKTFTTAMIAAMAVLMTPEQTANALHLRQSTQENALNQDTNLLAQKNDKKDKSSNHNENGWGAGGKKANQQEPEDEEENAEEGDGTVIDGTEVDGTTVVDITEEGTAIADGSEIVDGSEEASTTIIDGSEDPEESVSEESEDSGCSEEEDEVVLEITTEEVPQEETAIEEPIDVPTDDSSATAQSLAQKNDKTSNHNANGWGKGGKKANQEEPADEEENAEEGDGTATDGTEVDGITILDGSEVIEEVPQEEPIIEEPIDVPTEDSSATAQSFMEMLAQQTFSSVPEGSTHTCTYTAERLRDDDYTTYSAQDASVSGMWTDHSMEGWDAINWNDGNSGVGIDHSNWPFVMRRLSDVYATNPPTLFGDGGIDVYASRQGTVGNCYFLTATASIGINMPGYIENAFCNRDQFTENKGWIDVNMYAMNVPITIRVDDNVPVQEYLSYKFIKFAPLTSNNGAWVSILEKAFAKYRGSYGSMDAGTASDGFSALLGTPVHSQSWSNVSSAANYLSYTNLNAKLNEAVADNQMVGALTKSWNSYGIPTNHWYSVLGVYDVPRVGSTISYRMIKLRNPWGKDDANGSTKFTHPFHDMDPNWNYVSLADREAIGANVLNTQAENDGVFFMMPYHFYSTFQTIESTPDMRDWTRSYFMALDTAETENIHVMKIKSDVSQQAVLSVNVQNGDIYPRNKDCVSYYADSPLNASYMVSSPDLGQGAVTNTVGSNASFWLNNGEPLTLEAGKVYTMYLNMFGDNSKVARDFSVVALGEQGDVSITHATRESDHFFNSGCNQ